MAHAPPIVEETVDEALRRRQRERDRNELAIG
jgi:hypothetical protein